MTLRALRRFYRDLATIILNTLVLILLVNLLLFAYFSLKDRSRANASAITEDRWTLLQRVYGNLSRKEIQDLLVEMETRTFMYDPYMEYRERPYSGKYLNVDVHGFRQVNHQGPWPPDKEQYFTVFLFGGSTTFGYGVPDDQTIPSYLQEYLNATGSKKQVRVYNFGCEGYHSTQERILFENLISAGFRPNMAIFIDGLNDFWSYDDRPSYSNRFEQLMEGKLDEPHPIQFLQKVPMMQAASLLGQSLTRALKKPVAQVESPNDEVYRNENVLMGVIKRYAKNKQMIDAIAHAEGIKTLFVWQPISTYKYDPKYHLFAADAAGERRYASFGYPLMATSAERNSLGDNFLWLADTQERTTEPLYVDSMHYTGKMSKMLAKDIADNVVQEAQSQSKSK
jgi:lysophospholipase L1-like esterase